MRDDPESKEAVEERLELTRRALGYPTQTAFARAIGISAQKWQNYISKKIKDRITVDVAIMLCKRFGLTLDWIYLGDIGSLPVRIARQIESAESPPPPSSNGRRKSKK
jgi:plasmid maintenance system antidote protein VapI